MDVQAGTTGTRRFAVFASVLLSAAVAAPLAGADKPLTPKPRPGGPQGPTLLFAEVVVDGGPTFFVNGVVGLGDLTMGLREGPRNRFPITLGRVRFVRGFTTDRSLWDWRQQVVQGDRRAARHDVSVRVLDQTFNEVLRFELKDAWPESVTVNLDSDGTGVEELVLAHGAITRAP